MGRPSPDELENYIEFDKSDPFTRQRIECHIRSGIVGYRADNQNDAFYKAQKTMYVEEMQFQSRTIQIPRARFSSITRP